MPGQDLNNALIKVMTAQSAMSQYAAVIQGTLEDTVTLPGGQYGAGFVGVALNSASSGQTVAVHMAGGIAKMIAGSSVTAQSYAVICDVSGRIQNFIATNTTREVVGQILRNGVSGDVVPVMLLRFNA
jgi:hypothetical protein